MFCDGNFPRRRRRLPLQFNSRRTSKTNMASKLAFLLFFLLQHTKWSLAFAARRLGRKKQKIICPTKSKYFLGRLDMVRKGSVIRGSYFSYLLLFLECFPTRFDFFLVANICPWVFEDVPETPDVFLIPVV